MDRFRAAGLALSLVSVAGYVAGTLAAYPGRELSVIGLMVGVTLLGIGRGGRPAGSTDEGVAGR